MSLVGKPKRTKQRKQRANNAWGKKFRPLVRMSRKEIMSSGRKAHELRAMGFTPSTLRAHGLSVFDVAKLGFRVEELEGVFPLIEIKRFPQRKNGGKLT